jgi:FkbM family methyltransferase
MRVEACCQELLRQVLPVLDPQRKGVCFDVGVGTFALYCELFAELGFATVAVEPLPTKKLREICQRHSIRLFEQCLSDRLGTQTLHMGRFAGIANSNFSSLDSDWFGVSGSTKQVATTDLNSLLNLVGNYPITCFKLDIEGWEPVVIRQFRTLSTVQLPDLVMFEYGGGGNRRQNLKGWSPKYLDGTMSCLQTLQDLGYGQSIMIDYAAGTTASMFDLQAVDLSQDTLFPTNGVYGNILSFHRFSLDPARVNAICAPYKYGLVNWLVGKLISTIG